MIILIKYKLANLLSYVGFEKTVEYYRWKKKIKANIDYSKIASFDIDNNSKLIFIHIPKSAGMSMVKALYGKNKSHHAKALDYMKLDDDKFKEHTFFAISRNPYARLYSAYNYLKNNGMNIVDKVWHDIYIKQYKTFDDFILNGLEFAINENAEHFIPQYKFVVDDSNNLICDFIGNLEDMKSTYAFLKNKGIVLKLGHENTSSIGAEIYKDMYTPQTIDKVNKLYQRDFKLFGYELL
ncbi:sulfotransferase family 2 domain-containing protein [Colwellia sp. MB02u-10]|uniref:sulfotransferase family 2 domain-containing protein n=1 Tax=Colwellia sp. MB02u-10 TaxID=2759828 RepID=UPI0015F58220|nr:sulfotransferase family 2 domain-containing protein [Colwellia sp. MB02u-10]MBA6341496.1 sulfotransferase family 2 domain-containing protein [Colwellia sp. MB02u-10]